MSCEPEAIDIPVVEPDATPQDPEKVTTEPRRILVQTVTHLVPGEDWSDRIMKMRNTVCQRFWSRDFDWNQERFHVRGGDFGYENRNCYFLLDHGASETPQDPPPVEWYKWTGESFVPVDRPLPENMKSKLKKYEFSMRSTRPPRREPGRQPGPLEHRRRIQDKFRSSMAFFDEDFDFLDRHPEHARWLENNVEPRFWARLQSEKESHDSNAFRFMGGVSYRGRGSQSTPISPSELPPGLLDTFPKELLQPQHQGTVNTEQSQHDSDEPETLDGGAESSPEDPATVVN